jgi:hypothetical protein
VVASVRLTATGTDWNQWARLHISASGIESLINLLPSGGQSKAWVEESEQFLARHKKALEKAAVVLGRLAGGDVPSDWRFGRGDASRDDKNA